MAKQQKQPNPANQPDPKVLLENIIDAHIAHLEYAKSTGKKDALFYIGCATAGRYLAEYTAVYKDYPKIGFYGGKIVKLLK